jgi:eukaryotic-like serine/threonine-protein kinase
VKVLDFGLAKVLETETPTPNSSDSPTLSLAATRAGVILGTAAYMSPEQAKGRAVDRRTDVFAFGCVLFEMLAGQRAFDGDDVTDVLGAVLRVEPDWSRLPADVPPSVRRLLRLCLEKNPKNRRGTATDVRLDLREALKDPSPVAIQVQAPARGSWLAWIAAAILLVTTAVLSVLYFRPKPAATVVRFEVGIPEGITLARTSGEVSPDGQHVAFAATAAPGKPFQLWLHSLGDGETRPLSGTEGTSSPFWSPDSRFLGFAAGRELKRIAIAGGPAQTLCMIPGGGTGADGSWSSADVIVFGSSDNTQGIYRVPAQGGTPTPVTALDSNRGEVAHLVPEFLPDGQRFLYTVRAAKPENAGIYLGSLESEQTLRVMDAYSQARFAPPGLLLFVRNGALFAQRFDPDKPQLQGEPKRIADDVPVGANNAQSGFSVSENGLLGLSRSTTARDEFDLSWYDRKGNRGARIFTGRFAGIDLSPDMTQLAVHHHDESSDGADVRIKDLKSGSESRFTFDSTAHSSSPIWSPDGAAIAFSALRNGKWGLYRRPANQVGDAELLYESETPVVPTTWSADAKTLVFTNLDPKTGQDLWVLALDTRSPTPFSVTAEPDSHAQISRDGRWIAYRSGGRVFVESFPDRRFKREMSQDGQIPRWRADGKELFFTGGFVGTMWAVSVEPSGAGLKFGVPTALFAKDSPPIGHTPNLSFFTYAVSADGQRFAIPTATTTRATAETRTLTIVLNWPTLLK